VHVASLSLPVMPMAVISGRSSPLTDGPHTGRRHRG
jgi:hypothetical protein